MPASQAASTAACACSSGTPTYRFPMGAPPNTSPVTSTALRPSGRRRAQSRAAVLTAATSPGLGVHGSPLPDLAVGIDQRVVRTVVHFDGVTGSGGEPVAAGCNHCRVHKMLVEMIGELRRPVVHRSAHAHVVDDAEVLDILAQTQSAGVRTHGNTELGRQQKDGQHLVDST